MAYQIYYSPENNYKYPRHKNYAKVQWRRIALCVAVLTVAAICMRGRNSIIQWLLPGNPVQTQESLTELVDSVRAGEPLKDAVTAFCLEIIDHAQNEP